MGILDSLLAVAPVQPQVLDQIPTQDISVPESAPHQNIFQKIAQAYHTPPPVMQNGGTSNGQPVLPGYNPDMYKPALGRKSLIDVIGGIADAAARAGGATPGFQSAYDSNLMRNAAQEQQAFTQSNQPLQHELLQQQAGQQMRTAIGQSLGALVNDPKAADKWNAVAQQIGVPPQQAAAIAHTLQTNPGAAESLAQAFGYRPAQMGRQYSGSVQYARGPDGKLHAYALDQQTGQLKDVTPEGSSMAPSNMQIEDAGNIQYIRDPRTGDIISEVVKSGNPDTGYAPTGQKDANGNPIYAPMKGGAAQQRIVSTDAPKLASAQSLQGILGQMGGTIEQMDQAGMFGDSPNTTAVDNMVNMLGNTSAGRFVGRALRTQKQNLRDNLKSEVDQTMGFMQNALGLSGTQLNSYQEVENWKKAILDPYASKQSIMAANQRFQNFAHGLLAAREAAMGGVQVPGLTGQPKTPVSGSNAKKSATITPRVTEHGWGFQN